jgi:hypothetical protein
MADFLEAGSHCTPTPLQSVVQTTKPHHPPSGLASTNTTTGGWAPAEGSKSDDAHGLILVEMCQ